MQIIIEIHEKVNKDSLMNSNPNSSDQHHRLGEMVLAANDVRMNLKIAMAEKERERAGEKMKKK